MFSTGGVFMSSNESIRYQIVSKFLAGSINRKEASDLLQVNERTITRLSSKIKHRGIFGVKHANYGKSPSNRFPHEIKEFVIKLLCSKYLISIRNTFMKFLNQNIIFQSLIKLCGIGAKK